MLVSNPTVVDYSSLHLAAKIKVPSDLDGIFERNGKFLVLECKHSANQSISDGQRFLLEKLARQQDFTVLMVMLSGKRTEVGSLEFDPIALMSIGKGSSYSWEPINLEQFTARFQQWEQNTFVNPGVHRFVPDEELPAI